MGGLFYNLGKRVGPKWRKGVWAWRSLTGTEAERLEAEYAVGQDLAAQIDSQIAEPAQPEDRQAVQTITERLAACLADKRWRIAAGVLPSNEPNAFALPGGFIYLHTALLDLCQRRTGEMAFICAHEIGHVVRGHAMRRMIEQSSLNLALLASPTRGALGGWLKKAGLKFFASAYSRENEFEADRFAIRLMHAAGFDPQHGVAALQRLGKLEGRNNIPLSEYLSTHPPAARRCEEARKAIP